MKTPYDYFDIETNLLYNQIVDNLDQKFLPFCEPIRLTLCFIEEIVSYQKESLEKRLSEKLWNIEYEHTTLSNESGYWNIDVVISPIMENLK